LQRTYYVYFMTNMSRTLYIGVTSNLEHRVAQHHMKETEGFTKRYNLTMLAYMEEFATPGDAIAREKQLKGWRRARKIELIESLNPEWRDLAAGWFSSDYPS